MTRSPHGSIYLHGHISSRLLKALSSEGDNGPVKACLAFTNVDGLVVSFSPFHNRSGKPIDGQLEACPLSRTMLTRLRQLVLVCSNNYESAVVCEFKVNTPFPCIIVALISC